MHRVNSSAFSMWPPSVSPAEIVILVVVAMASFLLAARFSRWFLGIVACFVLVVLASPSDPASTLVGGALLSVLYGIAVIVSLWLIRDRDA